MIRKVAVLGAGNMGSRIAAHIANAGLPVVLLDIAEKLAAPGDKAARNAIVTKALANLSKAKPAAFFDDRAGKLITPGNLDDDLELIKDCDWVIEAVSENLEIKRTLLQRVSAVRGQAAIVTTNTSGLPVGQIAEGLPETFRRHWFGAHFFNPPRYMRLLEIIPTEATDPACIAEVMSFADRRLGKIIVLCKDTPNFIANRIGTFAMLNALRVMQLMDLPIEQVDALTGAAIGWPKMGTFRLADLVGVDVLANVAENFFARVKDERADLELPVYIREMVRRGWVGDKAGVGFYKKERSASGELRLGLDWKTLTHRTSERAKFPSLDLARNAESLVERIRLLLSGDPKKDQASAFYWQVLPELWNYAAHRIPEISDDLVSIDRAMKNGFNWELGPFEMWDAAGVPQTVERMKAAGMVLAPAVEKLLGSGRRSWYQDESSSPSGRAFFDPQSAQYVPETLASGVPSVAVIKKRHGVISKNPGASLIDLGDGIACIEFHTKMNAIGGDILSCLSRTLMPDSDAVRQFGAFVISGDAANFSVGANLVQLLLAMQEGEWDELEASIRTFQAATMAVKFCPRPVVVAPFGMCLGGGAEVMLHGAFRQAHAELYTGLVESGVGLVPAGGGCKEMVLRTLDSVAAIRDDGRSDSVELLDALKRTFETMAMAKVSTSAAEARQLGFLSRADGITMNRDRLLTDAKAKAREMADAGYAHPSPRTDIPAPGENILASLKMGVHMMRQGEYISDHDVKVANSIAHILCGGPITPGTPVSEQYFLELELQAFLSLCGETKTQERIAYTLKNGKPLRN